jgi:hypothetical protein
MTKPYLVGVQGTDQEPEIEENTHEKPILTSINLYRVFHGTWQTSLSIDHSLRLGHHTHHRILQGMIQESSELSKCTERSDCKCAQDSRATPCFAFGGLGPRSSVSCSRTDGNRRRSSEIQVRPHKGGKMSTITSLEVFGTWCLPLERHSQRQRHV